MCEPQKCSEHSECKDCRDHCAAPLSSIRYGETTGLFPFSIVRNVSQRFPPRFDQRSPKTCPNARGFRELQGVLGVQSLACSLHKQSMRKKAAYQTLPQTTRLRGGGDNEEAVFPFSADPVPGSPCLPENHLRVHGCLSRDSLFHHVWNPDSICHDHVPEGEDLSYIMWPGPLPFPFDQATNRASPPGARFFCILRTFCLSFFCVSWSELASLWRNRRRMTRESTP